MERVEDIRQEFVLKLESEEFVIDKNGGKVVEIIGATFLADEETIFGVFNHEYVERELEWYKSQSRNVNDIPGGPPTIWKQVATPDGRINSNYGWCIWSEENSNQYYNVLNELKRNPDSRRGQMIYTRPTMHYDYNTDGMSDFMCTAYSQHYIRNGKLVTHYVMRSNDSIFGYKNDRAWAGHVHEMLAQDLGIPEGDIIWTASSLHVYQRHFHLIVA